MDGHCTNKSEVVTGQYLWGLFCVVGAVLQHASCIGSRKRKLKLGPQKHDDVTGSPEHVDLGRGHTSARMLPAGAGKQATSGAASTGATCPASSVTGLD